MQTVYEEIRQLKERKTPLDQTVSMVLQKSGMSQNLQGFFYIRSAIIFISSLDYQDRVHVRLGKEVYPAVAKEFGTTSSRIERAIRHAIEVTYDYGNMNYLHNSLCITFSSKNGKPTNSQFICSLADIIGIV